MRLELIGNRHANKPADKSREAVRIFTSFSCIKVAAAAYAPILEPRLASRSALMLSQNRQRQYSQVFAQQFSTLVEIRSIVIEEVIPKVLDEIREKGDNELDDDELKWLQEWVDDLGE